MRERESYRQTAAEAETETVWFFHIVVDIPHTSSTYNVLINEMSSDFDWMPSMDEYNRSLPFTIRCNASSCLCTGFVTTLDGIVIIFQNDMRYVQARKNECLKRI